MTEPGPHRPIASDVTSRRSDVGRSRARNEDAVIAVTWPAPGGRGACSVLAVADGMGGADGGEVASRLAIEAVEEIVAARWAAGLLTGEDEWVAAYRQAFTYAAERMRKTADADGSLQGMGTTLTALSLQNGTVVFAHIGDSRAYLYRGGSLRRLTTDHNAAHELAAQGRIAVEEVATHRSRNVLTRWLGADVAAVEPEFGGLAAQPGDLFLVCSDGLHTMVSDPDLAGALHAGAAGSQDALDAVAQRLIEAANAAGGKDNISVALGLHVGASAAGA